MPSLYLVRHADAEPVQTVDAERRLTSKGREQAARLGRFFQEREFVVKAVFSSPLVRAAQTAELLAQPLGLSPVLRPELSAGVSPGAVRRFLQAQSVCDGAVIVGHEPDLSGVTADFLGCEPDRFRIRKATVIALSLAPEKLGLATLDFLVPVRFL
ncbi:MAG TPA: histidine phosphatase family protein [Chthoniobacterales bacterium]